MITPGDIESLVDRIGMLVSDSLLRRKFSDDAYNFITDNFSLKNNIGHLKKNIWRYAIVLCKFLILCLLPVF